MTQTLAQTPLHGWHVEHGGRMVEFAGWSMPVQYGSIFEEHQATRAAVGLFDISHMGRLRLEGVGAAEFLDTLLTRRVCDMPLGRVHYALLTNEQGGTIDDVLVSHLADEKGAFYLLVVNASNRQKVLEWFAIHLESYPDVRLVDQTFEQAMVAVQGPRAWEAVAPLCDFDPREMKYYTGRSGQLGPLPGIVSRTGYTGEDGWELVVPATAIEQVWDQLDASSRRLGGAAVGLAARDTLRLEAAMPLYGHELSESISPLQAGLDFAVDFEGRTFVGREALLEIKHDESLPRRVGLVTTGRRVPREGYPIQAAGRVVGEVTSGTFSPTLGKPIAMGYVAPPLERGESEWTIELRGRIEAARIVPLPFYRRIGT
jgi:aminomethyltransferase